MSFFALHFKALYCTSTHQTQVARESLLLLYSLLSLVIMGSRGLAHITTMPSAQPTQYESSDSESCSATKSNKLAYSPQRDQPEGSA